MRRIKRVEGVRHAFKDDEQVLHALATRGTK